MCGNGRSTLLWDMTIRCDQAIEARRPHIVFVDKDTREVKIIDIVSWRHSDEEEKNGEIPADKGRDRETMKYEKSLCGTSCNWCLGKVFQWF